MKKILFARPAIFFVVIAIFFAGIAACLAPDTSFPKIYLERTIPEFVAFFAIVMAPLIETIIFQQLPFVIIRKLFKYEVYKVVLLSLPFCVAHFSKIAPALSTLNGIAGGLLLGSCYIFYEKNLIATRY